MLEFWRTHSWQSQPGEVSLAAVYGMWELFFQPFFFLNSYFFSFFFLSLLFFLVKVLLHLYPADSSFAVGKCLEVAFLSPFHFLLIKLSRLSFWDNKKTVYFQVYSCIFSLEIIHEGTQTHFCLFLLLKSHLAIKSKGESQTKNVF